MIRVCQFSERLNGLSVTLVRHSIIKDGPMAGRDIFHCEVQMEDELSACSLRRTLYTTFYRCNLQDDSKGTEINNRIAELDRLAKGDAA